MNSNFKATINLPQAIALYIGAVLGAGILIVPGIAAEIAGPASILDWGVMMILVLPLAFCMAFLSQKYPNVGGVSYFVTKAFGDKLGTIIGWFFLMSAPIGAPVASLTGGGYLSSAIGLPQNSKIIIACIILIFALVINFIFKIVSFTQLIQIPSATFILTYLAGCAAGVVLFKDNKKKFIISLISLVTTAFIFIFSGWAILYPMIILTGVIISNIIKKYRNNLYKCR